MKVLEESYGQFVEGTSAKQYLIGLVQDEGAGSFAVVVFYSKIGASTLAIDWKTPWHIEQADADAVYAKTRKAKAKYNFDTIPKPDNLDIPALVAANGRI